MALQSRHAVRLINTRKYPMETSNLAHTIHKLWVGLRLRCPNCERGPLFSSFFTMHPACANCHVRFERSSGESLGGVMINLVLVELVTIGGYFLSEALFHPPLLFQIIFWVTRSEEHTSELQSRENLVC